MSLLDKYIRTRLADIIRPDTKFASSMVGFRTETLEVMGECKPYVLDEGTTRLCNSLVPDLKKEASLIDGVILPFDLVWVEFDRTSIIQEGAVKGLELTSNIQPADQANRAGVGPLANFSNPVKFENPNLKAAIKKYESSRPERIGFLFERMDDHIEISAVKSREIVLIDPMVVGRVPLRSDGTLDWAARSIASYDWVQSNPITSAKLCSEEWETLEAFIHIPFAFFALLASKETGLEQARMPSSFKARKIKDTARKAGLGRRVKLPDITTLKLSEIGKIHLESVGHDNGHQVAGADGKRASPRRHFVRGHLVSREGKTFWRTPHPRGGGRPEKHITTQVVDDIGPSRTGREPLTGSKSDVETHQDTPEWQRTMDH